MSLKKLVTLILCLFLISCSKDESKVSKINDETSTENDALPPRGVWGSSGERYDFTGARIFAENGNYDIACKWLNNAPVTEDKYEGCAFFYKGVTSREELKIIFEENFNENVKYINLSGAGPKEIYNQFTELAKTHKTTMEEINKLKEGSYRKIDIIGFETGGGDASQYFITDGKSVYAVYYFFGLGDAPNRMGIERLQRN